MGELVYPENILELEDALVGHILIEIKITQLVMGLEIIRIFFNYLLQLRLRLGEHLLVHEIADPLFRIETGGDEVDVYSHHTQQYS